MSCMRSKYNSAHHWPGVDSIPYGLSCTSAAQEFRMLLSSVVFFNKISNILQKSLASFKRHLYTCPQNMRNTLYLEGQPQLVIHTNCL